MEKKPHFAGFWIRAVADFIDSLILDFSAGLICLMILGVLFWVTRLTGVSLGDIFPTETVGSALGSLVGQIGFAVIRLILSLFYFTWATYRFGTTLGKRPFRIYVVDYATKAPVSLKQSLLRFFAYGVSYAPMGAGFLMAGIHPEKRALHDLIARTVSVIKEREMRPNGSVPKPS